MEENKPVKYKAIPFDALIKIEVSGTFAGRLHGLLIHYMQQKPLAEVQKILEHLKNNEPEDEFSNHLLTIIILIQEIEKQAVAQDLIKDMELDPNSISEN
jgi:outer membrane PBP1 activator LpoA protein